MPIEFSQGDSVKMVACLHKAEEYFDQQDYILSVQEGEKALQIANQKRYEIAKPRILLLLSRNMRRTLQPEKALRYALEANRISSNANLGEYLAESQEQVALIYYEQKNYIRADQYFENAKLQRQKNNQAEKSKSFLLQRAFIFAQKKELDKAREAYMELLATYSEEKQPQIYAMIIKQAGEMYVQSERYKDAIVFYDNLKSFYERRQNPILLLETYNNLGFLYKKSGNISLSIEQFESAINLYKRFYAQLNEEDRALISENASVAYANLKQYKRAQTLLQEALKIRQKKGDQRNTAHIFNLLAANHYISGDNLQALEAVTLALQAAGLATEADDMKITSYEILAKLYQLNNNPQKVQEVQTQAQLLRERLVKRNEEAQMRLQTEREQWDKKEDEIKNQFVEDERRAEKERDDEQKRSKEEQDKKLQQTQYELQQKELAIAREQQKAKEIELRNAELLRQQITQQLILAEQQAKYQDQQRQIAAFGKEKAERQLELEKKNFQQKETERILEQQRKRLEEEQDQRKIGIAFFFLLSALLIAVVVGLFYTRRNNKQLKEKNALIKTQSDEILLRNRTMAVQQEQIVKQNEALGIQNNKIQQSIRAAFTIQKSLLPKEERLQSYFREHFVIYRPKDVVSGDFYWVEKLNNQIFLVAADCTGHGVPGAFMSMIGNMLLDKIIEVRQIYDPALILQNLDHDVRVVLQQEENFDESGMDVCLCRITEHEQGQDQFHITISSAKRPFYYFNYQQKEIVEMKGDKKSIGIKLKNSPNFHYTNKEAVLHRNDSIYLCSDGYTDQANEQREKLGRKIFLKLIQDHAIENMATQGEIFEEVLARHQGDSEQIDDILLIGVKL